MNLIINKTQDEVKNYPLHKHNNYEIMIYLEGKGYMHTPDKDYPYCPGTIIIVPPGVLHGSVSVEGFRNISVSGDFSGLIHFSETICICDNERREATVLAKILYDNRFGNSEYLSKLCLAYLHFILQHTGFENNIRKSVDIISSGITDNFHNSDFKVSKLLQASCYAEDYIRSEFKKITGKTPGSFLTDVRINHALFLIDIYADSLSLEQVAERCGYTDYVYFSKKFKKVTGKSPKEYKNSVLKSFTHSEKEQLQQIHQH